MKPRDFARQLRSHLTDAEQRLWRELRAHRFDGFKFRRQQPIGGYIVDFVCFEQKLIVELDGGQHAENAEYDRQRDAWLQDEGFRVLRYWNNEVMGNFEGVLESILMACRRAPSPLAPLPQRERGNTDSRGTSDTPLPPRGGGVGGEGDRP